MGLDDQLGDRVRGVFQRAVVRVYWAALYNFVTKDIGVSKRELAKRIGVSRTTPYRWIVGGDNETDGQEAMAKEPTLRNFLLTLAAFDIDPEEDIVFPKGSVAAIHGYRHAFGHVDQVELGRKDSPPIEAEEVLCLHFALRSLAWRQAQQTRAPEQMQQAAEEIVQHMRPYVDHMTVSEPADVERILQRRLVPWTILETVILHDWF
jgi:hypothetical protein